MKYIHPQKEFADLIVNFFHQKKSSKIGLKLTFNANINVDYLIDKCKDVIWDYNDDLKTQYIILINTPILDFNKLSNQYIENFYEITNYNSKWLDGYNGLIQYIVMLLISEKLKVTN